MSTVDGSLKSWDDIKDGYVNGALVLGNGASRAVWDGFGYDSLFQIACGQTVNNKLDDDDRQLFKILGTTNFEVALAALRTTEAACRIFNVPQAVITTRYARIQKALAQAIKHSHVEYSSDLVAVLKVIRSELRRYVAIFSLNYDLIVYWAIMSEGSPAGFVDFFGKGGKFAPTSTNMYQRTQIYYLHGALHLYGNVDGTDWKRLRTNTKLLSAFGQPLKNAVPLIVTEGSAEDKLRVIGRSEYLRFCLKCLEKTTRPIVLFGVSLQASDKHIIEAITSINNLNLAVGIYASTKSDARRKKLSILSALDGVEKIDFFDSQSHPLGSPNLKATKA